MQLILAILILICSIHDSYSKSNYFKVFAFKGSVTISDKLVTRKVKVKKNHILELKQNAFVILYNEQGQFVQLEKAGKYNFETILQHCWTINTILEDKNLRKYILKELKEITYEPNLFWISKCGRPSTEFLMPKYFLYFDPTIKINWQPLQIRNKICKKYNFSVKDMYDVDLFNVIVTDTTYTLDLSRINLPKDKTILVLAYPLEFEVQDSEAFVLKKIIKPNEFNLIEEAHPNKTDELIHLLTGIIAEKYKIYPLAKVSYLTLCLKHPDIKIFKELYKIFLSKTYSNIDFKFTE